MFSSNPFAFNNNHMVFESNFIVDDENPNQNPPHDHKQLYPSSFLDQDEGFLMNQVFSHLQQDQQIMEDGNYQGDPNNINSANKVKTTKAATIIKKRGGGGAKETTPRKRKGKKDRHSKIYTAQGPRDRRMRLSLQVARKFFDLQDILGFDKASKTVEWLFSKSVSAIKELTDKFPGGGEKSVIVTVHSTSESEVVSDTKEIDEYNGGIMAKDHEIFVDESKKKGRSRKNFQVYNPNPMAKESREKARERARKRTEEKLMKLKDFDKSISNVEANPNEDFVQELNSSSLREENERKSRNQIDHSTKFFSMRGHLLGSASGSSFGNSSFNKVGASMTEESNDPVFTGNWEINNDRQVNYNGQCIMTNNMKLFSSGNSIQAQTSSTTFMNGNQQNPSSCFMINNSLNPNPNSTFMYNKNIADHHQQQNRNSNVGLQSQFLENLFEPAADNSTSPGYKLSLYGENLF
ncbi:hypothetical protein ACFE04_019174 [Oxalis oulophora]